MTETKHIVLTSHPPQGESKPPQINWGAASAAERGPVIGSLNNPHQRNVIGVHSGAYGLYRALAIAAGKLDPIHKPDLTNTSPTVQIGPFDQWADPTKIVSLDPPPFKLDRKIKNLKRIELVIPAEKCKDGQTEIKIRLSK